MSTIPDHATTATDLFNLRQYLEHSDLGCSLDGEEADRVGDRLYVLESLVANADVLVAAMTFVSALSPETLTALGNYNARRKDLP